MNCDRVQEELAAYLSGELPEESRRRVAAHLSLCQACAGELAAMQDLERRLRLGLTAWVEAGEAPADLEPALRQAVRQRRAVDVAEVLAEAAAPGPALRRAEARRGRWRGIALAAAAAAAVALLAAAVPDRPAAHRLPVVGSLVALFRGDVALHPGPSASVSAGGVTLAVEEVRFTGSATYLTCTLAGTGDRLPGLRLAAGREVPLRRVRAEAGPPWRVEAEFAPVPPGQPVHLVVEVPAGPALNILLPPRP